jgi:hypothetical protein
VSALNFEVYGAATEVDKGFLKDVTDAAKSFEAHVLSTVFDTVDCRLARFELTGELGLR